MLVSCPNSLVVQEYEDSRAEKGSGNRTMPFLYPGGGGGAEKGSGNRTMPFLYPGGGGAEKGSGNRTMPLLYPGGGGGGGRERGW